MGFPMGFDRYFVLRKDGLKDNACAGFPRNSGTLGCGLFRCVEKVVGGIRSADFLAYVRGVAAGRGSFATFGVEALDGCGARENAGAFVAHDVDEKPGNGIGVRRRSISNGFAGDTAAVVRFPGWCGEMFAEGFAILVE